MRFQYQVVVHSREQGLHGNKLSLYRTSNESLAHSDYVNVLILVDGWAHTFQVAAQTDIVEQAHSDTCVEALIP